MKGFKLSPEEIQELCAAHKAAKSKKDVKAAYKINAIILLGEGWTASQVSEALLLDEDTLGNYTRQESFFGVDGVDIFCLMGALNCR